MSVSARLSTIKRENNTFKRDPENQVQGEMNFSAL